MAANAEFEGKPVDFHIESLHPDVAEVLDAHNIPLAEFILYTFHSPVVLESDIGHCLIQGFPEGDSEVREAITYNAQMINYLKSVRCTDAPDVFRTFGSPLEDVKTEVGTIGVNLDELTTWEVYTAFTAGKILSHSIKDAHAIPLVTASGIIAAGDHWDAWYLLARYNMAYELPEEVIPGEQDLPEQIAHVDDILRLALEADALAGAANKKLFSETLSWDELFSITVKSAASVQAHLEAVEEHPMYPYPTMESLDPKLRALLEEHGITLPHLCFYINDGESFTPYQPTLLFKTSWWWKEQIDEEDIKQIANDRKKPTDNTMLTNLAGLLHTEEKSPVQFSQEDTDVLDKLFDDYFFTLEDNENDPDFWNAMAHLVGLPHVLGRKWASKLYTYMLWYHFDEIYDVGRDEDAESMDIIREHLNEGIQWENTIFEKPEVADIVQYPTLDLGFTREYITYAEQRAREVRPNVHVHDTRYRLPPNFPVGL